MTPADEKPGANHDPRLARRRKIRSLIGIAIFVSPGVILVGGLHFLITKYSWYACDEGVVQDASVENSRGDVVSEYLEACTGIGTDLSWSITLKATAHPALVTVARFDHEAGFYPRMRWENDNTLALQFRKDQSVWSRLTRVGDIRVLYDFSAPAPVSASTD